MYRYWAKTSYQADATPGWHPLIYHSLDVAAVGASLIQRHPGVARAIAKWLDLPDESAHRLFTYLLALHDIGKFSGAFQGKCPAIAADLLADRAKPPDDARHTGLGFLAWTDALAEPIVQRLWPHTGSDSQKHWDLCEGLEAVFRAIAGHHGEPPEEDARLRYRKYFTGPDPKALETFARQAFDLLIGEAPLTLPEDTERWADWVRRGSWWLAGIAVICDWLGSNTAHFPFHEAEMDLAAYWGRCARVRADDAVAESGVVPAARTAGMDWPQLFPEITHRTPAQRYCDELELDTGPQLFVLEDTTGSGKTEAALRLVQRLLAGGQASGFYFALPTMATANAMYARIAPWYQRLFADETNSPSMVLAHSADDRGRPAVTAGIAEAVGSYGAGEEPTANATCAAWIADHRKRALLAEVGVGTIDQALLSVLPVRHQSVRLYGLSDKVLVVDEVHASDAYVHELLKRTLTFHAAAGGSAILLSATLPDRMRRDLAQAFRQGVGEWGSGLTAAADAPYPALMRARQGGADVAGVDVDERQRRWFDVELVHSIDEVIGGIEGASEAGSCIVWVRNTVADAIEAYEALVERLGFERVTLLHARFALGDRLEIERGLLARFGASSASDDRRGQVVVATQVVEQSLDVDFDTMISDLAPIDLVLQRAGRWRRHHRSGRPPTRWHGWADEQPKLRVLSPVVEPEPDAGWYQRFLPRAGYVYPDHAVLWRTARVLARRRRVVVPDTVRELVEEVLGDDPDVPVGLEGPANEAQGQKSADASLAKSQALELDAGYARSGPWLDEGYTPTRLGEPTVIVRLTADAPQAGQWVSSSSDPRLTEVRIRRYLVAGLVAACDSGEIPTLAFGVSATQDTTQAVVKDDKGKQRRFLYDPYKGLREA